MSITKIRMDGDYLKLKAYWIIEKIVQKCVVCKKDKTGSFLIINLPNKKYLALCEGCYKRG